MPHSMLFPVSFSLLLQHFELFVGIDLDVLRTCLLQPLAEFLFVLSFISGVIAFTIPYDVADYEAPPSSEKVHGP